MRKYSTVEVALEAVRQTGRALRLVPERLKTPAVCLEAVKMRGLSLLDVPAPLRSEEMCTTAVRQHPSAMMHVPVRHRDAVRTALAQEADASTEPEAEGPRP